MLDNVKSHSAQSLRVAMGCDLASRRWGTSDEVNRTLQYLGCPPLNMPKHALIGNG